MDMCVQHDDGVSGTVWTCVPRVQLTPRVHLNVLD